MVSIKHLSKNKHFLLEKKRERGGNSKTRGAKKKQKKRRKKTKKRKKYDEIEKQVLKSSKTTNSKILPSQIKRGGARENLFFFLHFLSFFINKSRGDKGVIKGLEISLWSHRDLCEFLRIFANF